MGARVTRRLTVNAGDGDDVVDATLAPRGWPVEANLGPGADEFHGSPVSDHDTVSAGPRGETDRDVLHGGGGRDTLISHGGPDEVYGDAGGDFIDAPDTMPLGGVIDGGAARDAVVLDLGRATWQVDLATGATRDDVRTHTWSSIEKLTATRADGHLILTGSPGPDEVAVLTRRGSIPLVDLDTGRGDDVVQVIGGLEDTSGLDLGRGSDQVRLERDGYLSLSLRAGTLVMDGVADVRGVEHATAYARETVLIGSDRRNRLRGGQCDTRIQGRGGPDDITWGTSTTIHIDCEIARSTVLHGGGGADTIVGSWAPDRIDAGPGRDTVDGGRGADLCASAERRTSCKGRP